MKKGVTIWITGYSGSGKTTIAKGLYQCIAERSIACEILDGDIIRQHLSKGLSFSKEDRCENIMRIGFVAEMLTRHGVFVIVSAISPYISARSCVRNRIENFVEVYSKCSIDECARRDVKGLYEKVKNGEIKNFTGISDPYEAPTDPEIICDTEVETVEESINKVLDGLRKLNYL
jgi:adenylylsulfate kinase